MITPKVMQQNSSRFVGESGRYQLQRRLGGGGMGNVFLARDTRLDCLVALKILKEFLADDSTMRRRFEWELAICAALKNPHIVQVRDYGVTDEGYPFYVMEYLQGETLGQRLAKVKRFSPSQVCQIITQVCSGLQQAHQGITVSGENIKVIHRDLKPENIFLATTAMGDLVKVIDFGIAKVQRLQGAQTQHTNLFLGTCHYAAPEQFKGSDNLDERVDIYSLGLIMYEMLSGTDPFGLDFRHKPVSPESWLAAHLSQNPVPLRSMPGCEHLSPCLERLIMRCLAKSPSKRFASIMELSKSLHEICHAGRQGNQSGFTWIQQLGIGILTTSFLGLGVFTTSQIFSPTSQPTTRNTSMVTQSYLSVVQTWTSLAYPSWTVALSEDGETVATGNQNHSITLRHLSQEGSQITLLGHTDVVRSVVLSPDGKYLVSGGTDKIVKIWDLKTNRVLHSLSGHQDTIWSVAISPDGETIASASTDGTIKLWHLDTGKLLATLSGNQDWLFKVIFTPDGETLVSSSKDGAIQLWDWRTQRQLLTLSGHSHAVRDLAVDPQGLKLASASWDGTVKLWDLQTGQELFTLIGHEDRVVAVTFLDGGKTLATGSIDSTIKLWNLSTQTLQQSLNQHSDWILSLASDSSGTVLVSSSRDQTVKIWQP